MPKPYPREFREDVVRVARNRDADVTLAQMARDFSDQRILSGRLVEEGRRRGRHEIAGERGRRCREPGIEVTGTSSGAGERGPAPRGGVPRAGEPAGKMMFPLDRKLAADGFGVAVTCRVLNIARQPYYRWLAGPVTEAELVEAYRANAGVRRPWR